MRTEAPSSTGSLGPPSPVPSEIVASFDVNVTRFFVSSPGFTTSLSDRPVRSCGSVEVDVDVDAAVVVLVVVTDTIDVEVVVGGGHAPRWRQVPPTAHASTVHGSPSLQMTP